MSLDSTPNDLSAAHRRIEEWKRRLIDGSRNNQLIYWKRSERSLEIAYPDFSTVLSDVMNRKRLLFFSFSEKEEEAFSEVEKTDRSFLLGRAQALASRSSNYLVNRNVFFRKPLDLLLRRMHSRAKSDFLERGIRVFYLFAGLLNWIDPQTGQPIRSPLFLIPVDLFPPRKSAQNAFSFMLSEDDALINPALEAKLFDLYSFKFPDLIEMDTGDEISQSIERLEGVFAERNWSIERTICPGCFSFHKIVLYNDLRQEEEHYLNHPIVRGFAGISAPDFPEIPRVSKEEGPLLAEIETDRDRWQILDADSSQQAVIEAALKGKNIVLQGPPGTGKSQTISNLIGEWIARGQKILFVSEKIAALEVVKKRLEECGLDRFCLELHSHKVNKKTVIQELKRSYEGLTDPNNAKAAVKAAEFDFNKLEALKQELDAYPDSLHRTIPPMEKSLYEMFGFLAASEETIDFVDRYDFLGTDNQPGAWHERFPSVFKKVAEIWDELIQSPVQYWRGLKYQDNQFLIRETVEKSLSSLAQSVMEVHQMLQPLSRTLSFLPRSLRDTEKTLAAFDLLRDVGALPPEWLSTDTLDRSRQTLLRIIRKEELFQNTVEKYKERFHAEFLKQSLPQIDRNLVERFGALPLNKLESLSLQTQWLQKNLKTAYDTVSSLLTGINTDPNTLLYSQFETYWRVMAALSQTDGHPSLNWLLHPQKLREVRELLRTHRPALDTLRSNRAYLREKYTEQIYSLDLVPMIEKMDSFFFTFSKPMKALKECALSGKLTQSWKEDLKKALYVKEQEPELQKAFIAMNDLPGGATMNPSEYLEKFMKRYESTVSYEEKNEEKYIAIEILSRIKTDAAFSSQVAAVSQAFQTIQQIFGEIREICGADLRSVFLPMTAGESLRAIDEYRQALIPLINFYRTGEGFLKQGAALPMTTLSELSRAIGEISEIQGYPKEKAILLEKIETSGAKAPTTLPEMRKLNTQMEQILQAAKFLRSAGFPSEKSESHDHPWGKLNQPAFFQTVLTQRDQDRLTEALRLLTARRQALLALFDPQSCLWTKVFGEGVSFTSQMKYLAILKNHLGQIPAWIRFETTIAEEGRSPITQFLALAMSARVPAKMLPHTLLKTLYKQTIKREWERNNVLRHFTPRYREEQIEEFRKMDRQSIRVTPSRIARRVMERIKKDGLPEEEVRILLAEADKKRNVIPVRKLFERIPELLFSLKPCMMMSPLTASQLIPLRSLAFDAVVFDEASQIFTEDAIGALCRARQFVIAGDSKQLPPTNFFQVLSRLSNEESESAEEALEDSSANYDSVLEEIQRVPNIQRLTLNWHYRSKSEALISFSNKAFYNDRLVTFPEPYHSSPALGVKYVFVPDGVYDRGKSRQNEAEARKVVELVFEHFTKHPAKSLGVIALSEAQMDAIQDELDKQLVKNEKYRNFFLEDRLNGFFVKNLENVQGDERDVIILSVGYGKDRTGKFSFQFGPINQQGGERRLNVAITRAREKMIVVSSISSADLSVSGSASEGLRALKNYLAYAEQGVWESPSKASAYDEAADNAFSVDSDVAKTLQEWGLTVFRHVGNGPFRLDIAVLDPDEEGAYQLGIECDGPEYRAVRSTRDRERLHFEVLQRMGWRVHRIWSPSWVQNKTAELEALRKRLRIEKSVQKPHNPTYSGIVAAPRNDQLLESKNQNPL